MRRRQATSTTTSAHTVGQGGGVGCTFDVGTTSSPPLPRDQSEFVVSENARVTHSPILEGGGEGRTVDSVSAEEARIAAEAEEAHLQFCREDVNAFIEYVMVDEESGAYLEQAKLHVLMHKALEEQGANEVRMMGDVLAGEAPATLEESEDARGGARLIVMAHPESGKTNQLGVGRTLWLLGKNPNLRLVLLGNTQGGAKKTLSVIKRYIERGGGKEGCFRLRKVFPDLLPGPNRDDIWTSEAIVIKRNLSSIKDPTIQCIGYRGAIVGSRVDGVVADDFLDAEVTRNENVRKEISGWWASSVMSRLGARAWVIFLTNAWHQHDLAHELERKGWRTLRFPVINSEGQPTWRTRWPLWRIRQVRENDMTELEFARTHLCKPRDDGAVTFQPEALQRCQDSGQGYGLVLWLDPKLVEMAALVVHGVDLAVTKKKSGARTCIFSIYVHPNGLRQVIGIRSGRWGAREILENLRAVGEALGGVAVVEDNAAQKYLIEIAQELDSEIPIPVLPFTTGHNKVDPNLGIDSMAAEFEAGRWIVPVGEGVVRGGKRVYLADRELRFWLEELSAYDPLAHSGDRLMASWIGRTYAMRLQRYLKAQQEQREGTVNIRVLGSG